MKAIVVREAGGPEVLRCEDFPAPKPGPAEVLIQNLAAGINFSDVGRPRNAAAAGLPLFLGSEAAGPGLAVGDDVSDFKIGDSDACQGISGAYAEQVLCRVRDAAEGGGSRDQGGRLIRVPPEVKPDVAV